jgi:hypothetical protein
MEWKKYIGIVLLLLMVMSSFTIGFTRTKKKIEIPTNNILTELTEEQKKHLIDSGKTIIIFNKAPDCKECENVSSYLNDFAFSYKDQVYLLERDAENSSVIIESIYGKRMVGADEKAIKSALCDLMAHPPSDCV